MKYDVEEVLGLSMACRTVYQTPGIYHHVLKQWSAELVRLATFDVFGEEGEKFHEEL